MKMSDQYFEVKKLCSSVIVLQEKISYIHPVYRNDPLNLYLILGKKSALLLDTGCDQHPLKPIVNKIIENRELIVLNSHAHWDHVLGNHQFEKIYIHKSETQF
ncbi:MAG: MBL fold metallo-hydrolase, partial [Candidatus Lokiarchaeota archaeon]|nr:MBL fold metallo-hydrolase [Candidatus Lokiarchaeota archaeon]